MQKTRFLRLIVPLLTSLTVLASSSAYAQLPLVDLTKKVKSSVVEIEADIPNGKRYGTGFVVSDKMVVTNHHVIDSASKVVLVFHDDSRVVVDGMLHDDEDRDIAVLSVSVDANKMIPLKLAKAYPEQGLEVAAYGNPGNGGYPGKIPY